MFLLRKTCRNWHAHREYIEKELVDILRNKYKKEVVYHHLVLKDLSKVYKEQKRRMTHILRLMKKRQKNNENARKDMVWVLINPHFGDNPTR